MGWEGAGVSDSPKKEKKKPYRCFCGRTSPGGCDVQGGACAWKAKP